MKFYADLPARRLVQVVADVFMVAWVLRLRFVRRATSAQRHVDSAQALDLFALRAMAHQPLERLSAISADPAGAWRRGELEAARARLTLAARVGLVMRRCRKERRLSQRALAAGLGWSPSAVGRAEVDAARLSLESLEHVLAFTGYRLAIVPDRPGPAEDVGEDPDQA